MQTRFELQVDTSDARLDRFVAEHLTEFSRVAVQRLIDEGQIVVDGIARKASYRVEKGETISVRIPPPVSPELRPEKIPLDIIFENRDLLVINKPAGMVVHPAAGHDAGTLVNAILGHSANLKVGGEKRPGIVHRLDRDTSGLIVVAKNDAAMNQLQEQFKSRTVEKAYLALVEGRVRPPNGKIDAPIGRDPKKRERMKVETRGRARQAVTIYRTIANLDGYTLLQAEPQTGRTHQIRVHLAFLGFAVVGDEVYGRGNNELGLARQFLHAWKLAFDMPRDRKRMEFTAPLPQDLSRALAKLGFDSQGLGRNPKMTTEHASGRYAVANR
jgi:23S rRNA pseudouridine1911/1915/1917 synthase